MKRIILALALLLPSVAFAQQANIAQPSAPCVAFGAASGTCAQGNDSRITGAAPLNSPSFTGAPTAPTVSNFTDSTTKIATTAFVQSVVNYSMATANLNIAGAGGTYSFASKGSGGLLSLTVNGSGVITAATETSTGGTGYAVGDIISVPGGNNDAFLQVATLSGSAYATLTVLYGGTGYSAGTTAAVSAAAALPFTFTLSGAITGDVTFIMPNGPINQLSNQWIFNNNTTGAHKVSVFISNGSDTATGTGVVIPQGSGNSAPTFVQTDGATDVWLGTVPSVGSILGLGTNVATALGNTAGGSGGFALQSSLGSYLPLAGGTMTGAITNNLNPTVGWQLNTSGQVGITVAHSSCTTLTNVTGSGLIVLQAENGNTIGVFAYGGGTTSLISAGATSTAWIVGSSPTADQIGLNFTGTVLQVCAGSDTTWDTYPNVKAMLLKVGSGF